MTLASWRASLAATLAGIDDPLVRLRVHDARCGVPYAHDDGDCTPRSHDRPHDPRGACRRGCTH